MGLAQREDQHGFAHLVVAVSLEDVEDGLDVFEVVHACTCSSVVWLTRLNRPRIEWK